MEKWGKNEKKTQQLKNKTDEAEIWEERQNTPGKNWSFFKAM